MMKQEKNMQITYRVLRPSCRWTQGGFKTFEDAVAYAKKDWGFHDRATGLIHDDVVFQYEIHGKAYRFDYFQTPYWAA